MLCKSATIFTWAALSYALLVFWAPGWWTGALLAVSLGLAMAGTLDPLSGEKAEPFSILIEMIFILTVSALWPC